MTGQNKAAIIGGGVIGGGWAARFLLNGWDVTVFDPDPEAERKIHAVLVNARRSLPKLADVAMPEEGKLVFVASIKEAVMEATWVQESVPERLDFKQKVFADIQAHVPKAAIIGSSTSGFTPSDLQQGAADAGQIIVTHPFNPVYLLPVIELVPSSQNSVEMVERAMALLTSIGLKPLQVRAEIDAHIADRLLEAVWREALWLVKDGVATTEEIDDVIRFGFGLRWAQMGLFETYRIAGGEAGMKHFISQFGPALSWPWTKLMDVPELTDELIEKIAEQSDAQSGQYSIRELEQIRDDNLVGFMRVLKDNDWGAGALLNQYDKQLKATQPTAEKVMPSSQPLRLRDCQVLPSWIDYNGHMTEHRYLEVFSATSDALLLAIGADDDYVNNGKSYFTVETHIMHIDEVKVGTALYSTAQLLKVDAKRIHVFYRLHVADDDRVIATAEQMLLHVNLAASKACPAEDAVMAKLQPLADAHVDLPIPEKAGRYVGER